MIDWFFASTPYSSMWETIALAKSISSLGLINQSHCVWEAWIDMFIQKQQEVTLMKYNIHQGPCYINVITSVVLMYAASKAVLDFLSLTVL